MKKLVLGLVVALTLTMFAGNAFAAYWLNDQTPTSVSKYDNGKMAVAVGTTYYYSGAGDTEANSYLAVVLTAISLGKTVNLRFSAGTIIGVTMN